MKTQQILFAVYCIVIAFLLASVIHSGYSYLFDPDELFHGNVVFLLQHGLVPYKDFFVTYTPFFHWFLTPVSFFTGFTFSFFEAARVGMIVLFIIRLTLIFFIARKLFGPSVASMSILLSLFDSFTVFSAMQIRPDNLMMTAYIAGLFFLMSWYFNKKSTPLLWAGFLLGFSVLVLFKNLPATVIVVVFTLLELKKTSNRRGMVQFLLAMTAPAAIFAVWTVSRGIFPLMIQQVLFDAKQLNDTLRYPQNILNYYWPPNFVLYGYPGRPLTWAYELCLPLVAFAGMFTVFLDGPSFGSKRRFIGWLTAACFLQWLSLLFVRSVFLQYFLPVSWFLVVFAAYALTRVHETAKVNRLYRQLGSAVAVVLLVGGLGVSWQANSTRAKSSYAAQKAYLTSLWRTIPETSSVFPGAVFRLSVYPLGFETNFVDFSPRVLRRYGSPSVYLSRFSIPFILLDPYNFSFLDAQTQDYIRAHYQQDSRDQNMWILRN